MGVAVARKRGRPAKADAATLDEKAFAANLLLIGRAQVKDIERRLEIDRKTLYAWVRQVCDSGHELAPVLQRLASDRGLWKPRSDQP